MQVEHETRFSRVFTDSVTRVHLCFHPYNLPAPDRLSSLLSRLTRSSALHNMGTTEMVRVL